MASYLSDAELTRRQIIRKIAGRAHAHGWQFSPQNDGWWLPNGDMLTVEQLFRAPSPAHWLEPIAVEIRGEFTVIETPEITAGGAEE